MLADMNEQMKEHKPGQISIASRRLNRENAIRKQEALKQFNDQLQAQIATLPNTQTQMRRNASSKSKNLPTFEP